MEIGWGQFMKAEGGWQPPSKWGLGMMLVVVHDNIMSPLLFEMVCRLMQQCWWTWQRLSAQQCSSPMHLTLASAMQPSCHQPWTSQVTTHSSYFTSKAVCCKMFLPGLCDVIWHSDVTSARKQLTLYLICSWGPLHVEHFKDMRILASLCTKVGLGQFSCWGVHASIQEYSI